MDTEKLLTGFKALLQGQGYSHHTIKSYHRCNESFFNWLNTQGYTPFNISYQILLNYVKVIKQKGNKVKTINTTISNIKLFYRSLLGEENTPISQSFLVKIIHDLDQLKLRGGTRFVLYDLLDEEQLAAIYEGCPTETMHQVRNKCMLGMFIYQGLNMGQIERLEVGDLQLEKVKVYIVSTRKSNERILALHPNQLFLLQKYVLGIRPALLRYTKIGKSDKLFCNQNGSKAHLRNSLMGMMQKLKKVHPQLQSVRQIHRSVIHNWIKKDNIRLVQYKLGHRYLSSTQQYLEGDIESLQQQIDRLHPLNE